MAAKFYFIEYMFFLLFAKFISSITDIKLNQKVEGEIYEDRYVYYKIDVSNITSQYLYLTLSNLYGNSELIVNYINAEKPTLEKSDLTSTTPNDEFLLVDLKDTNFKPNNNNEKIIFIGVYGYFQSSYSLYATTHSKAVYPLSKRGSCRAGENQYCFFSYSDITPNAELDMLVSTNYLYGRGVIYSSIHPEKTKNGTLDWEMLVNTESYDLSSEKEGYENSLIIHSKYI